MNNLPAIGDTRGWNLLIPYTDQKLTLFFHHTKAQLKFQ